MNVRTSLENDPELARAYSLYRDCRGQQFVSVEIPKDGGKKSALKLQAFTTGYNFLPNGGGILDQPFRLMAYFDQFRSGESRAFYENLNK